MNSRIPKFEDPRTVLKRYGFSPKRSWGQNFLISRKAIERIAGLALDSEDRRVIEIGAGVGTLTGELLRREGCVTAIERDRDMCEVLRREFGHVNRFELREEDAKSIDYESLFGDEEAVVTGNLPYQLTGPLLKRIMNIKGGLKRAVIMVQEEVGNRICATVDDRARGALSVMIRARFQPRIAVRLAPTAFYPPPKVKSVVVVLEKPAGSLLGKDLEPEIFDEVVKAAFSSRRKYLRNTLVSGGAGTKMEIKEALKESGIDPQLRPEKLTKEQFAAIATSLKLQRDLGSK